MVWIENNTFVIKILLLAENNKIYIPMKIINIIFLKIDFSYFTNTEFVRRKEISHAAEYFNLF